MYVDGCAVFRAISPNLVPDECAMKNDDEGNSDEVRYSKVRQQFFLTYSNKLQEEHATLLLTAIAKFRCWPV